MCCLLHHNKHAFTPLEEAAAVHRKTIEAASASVVASTAGATAAVKELYALVNEMERNKEATTKEIQQGFRIISQASIKQRDILLKDADARYKVKRALVEAQIAELGGIATRPGAALQLTEATLAAATKVELLGGAIVGRWVDAVEEPQSVVGKVPWPHYQRSRGHIV